MKTHYRVLSVIVTVVMLIGLMPGFAIASDSQINTETVSYRTPAIFADAGDTIFLSKYNVMFSETTTVAAKDITWISGTATVTNGTVYVANKGVYTLTATSGDLTKTIYIIAKEKSETEYVLYEMDYSDLSSVDDLKNAGFVIAEQPTGFTIGIENEALAIKGNTTKDKNVNARIILPEWLGDFGDVNFSSDIKITKASNTNRYFSLMYRVQNDNFYYPLYCATFRAKTTGHNINYAPGLNSGKTPDWKTGVAISDTANLFDSKSHNFTVSLNGKNVKASVDGTTVIDNNYIGAEGGNFATGYLGYFVRGIDIEIYSTKVTVKKPTQYEKLVPAINPAILANTGDTIDLTKYGVTADDGTILFENAVWTSDDITITNGKVTPANTGVYKFNVTEQGVSKTVYLLVKAPADKEYVLYNIDYSDVSSVTDLTDKGFVIAEQPTGFTIGIENEALAIKGDSTNTKNVNARVILPTWLGDFGNYSMSSDIKVTKATNTGRYFSLMYRVQDSNYYPIYTATFRARGNTNDIGYAPGLNSSNAPDWKPGVNMSSTTSLMDGKAHNFKVSVFDNNVKAFFDDTNVVDSDFIGKNTDSNYASGYLGYFVRGVDIEIYSTKVVYVNTPVANTDKVPSNVILPASAITNITSESDLKALSGCETAPATAILNVDKDLNVVDADSKTITTVTDALTYLGTGVIPAFYVSDEATATAVAEYTKNNVIPDAFVISSDANLIKKAREGYNMLRGVLDFSGKTLTEADLYNIRKQTNESGSRVCILPENLESKKNVEYLQRLFMAVWVTSDGTTVDTVADITSGASGIITQKITDLVVAYNKYFSKNTMTRPVGIIGHQGNYVLGQPNTVAGSLNAYNLGATAIETDIHLSKDGVIIAMHDDTLDRASTGTGKISDYTYEQLKAFEVDQHGGADHEPIATLEDYFKAFDGLDVQLIVEIKTTDSAVCQKLADLIEQYNIADQVNVICFDLTQLSLFKSIMPEISTGLLYNSLSAQEQKPENTVYSILELVQKYDSTYNPQYSVGPLGPEVLRAALDRGINVYPYTIDNNTELSNYFMYGAHAITTNYCHKFTDAVKSLTTDKSAYYSKTSDVPVTVNANTYARTATPVTNASLVFVDGDDIFTYADGKITANGEGRATLMFSYACKSVNNETYYVVTEPFTVAVSATDPVIALNILQDEVKDITNADGKYCQDAYAKFDAARNLNANTLSNEQALQAIADIEALTIHNSDFRYITTLNTHQKECVHCGVKQDAVSHDFENNTDELCETCEFTRYLFAVNYTDDKGMIDVSKAVLLSNETALVNAKDGDGVKLSWRGTDYVFIKGTNAFTSLAAIQAKNLDNPHILVKNNTEGTNFYLNFPAKVFTQNYAVNPVKVGTANDGSDWAFNSTEWNTDYEVSYDYIGVGVNASNAAQTVVAGDYGFYGFTISISVRDYGANAATNVTLENTRFHLKNWADASSYSGYSFVTASKNYPFTFNSKTDADKDALTVKNAYFSVIDSENGMFGSLFSHRTSNSAVNVMPEHTTFDGILIKASKVLYVLNGPIGKINGSDDSCLTIKNSCFVNYNIHNLQLDIESVAGASQTRKLAINNNTFYNSSFRAVSKQFLSIEPETWTDVEITNNTIIADSTAPCHKSGMYLIAGAENDHASNASAKAMKLNVTDNHFNFAISLKYLADNNLRAFSSDSVIENNYVRLAATDAGLPITYEGTPNVTSKTWLITADGSNTSSMIQPMTFNGEAFDAEETINVKSNVTALNVKSLISTTTAVTINDAVYNANLLKGYTDEECETPVDLANVAVAAAGTKIYVKVFSPDGLVSELHTVVINKEKAFGITNTGLGAVLDTSVTNGNYYWVTWRGEVSSTGVAVEGEADHRVGAIYLSDTTDLNAMKAEIERNIKAANDVNAIETVVANANATVSSKTAMAYCFHSKHTLTWNNESQSYGYRYNFNIKENYYRGVVMYVVYKDADGNIQIEFSDMVVQQAK